MGNRISSKINRNIQNGCLWKLEDSEVKILHDMSYYEIYKFYEDDMLTRILIKWINLEYNKRFPSNETTRLL